MQIDHAGPGQHSLDRNASKFLLQEAQHIHFHRIDRRERDVAAFGGEGQHVAMVANESRSTEAGARAHHGHDAVRLARNIGANAFGAVRRQHVHADGQRREIVQQMALAKPGIAEVTLAQMPSEIGQRHRAVQHRASRRQHDDRRLCLQLHVVKEAGKYVVKRGRAARVVDTLLKDARIPIGEPRKRQPRVRAADIAHDRARRHRRPRQFAVPCAFACMPLHTSRGGLVLIELLAEGDPDVRGCAGRM